MTTTDQTKQPSGPFILIVDDNAQFIIGIQLTLEMEGFEILAAENGQDALDQLEAAFKAKVEEQPHDPLPDLILADIMMPVMDGYTFYEQVRVRPYLNHIPFIFLTAKASDTDVRLGKELGPDDYLSKLSSTEDLLATIRGKLKRAKEREIITNHYAGGISNPPLAGNVILIAAIVVMLMMACCIGVAIGAMVTSGGTVFQGF